VFLPSTIDLYRTELISSRYDDDDDELKFAYYDYESRSIEYRPRRPNIAAHRAAQIAANHVSWNSRFVLNASLIARQLI